jgi:hypothetical protein
MKSIYEDSMTLREARDRYFAVNGFGPNGGYDDTWVDFKLGPIPLPFPNTKGRVAAVKFHDLHHILTGFDTNASGEFEISAWEIGAGCKDMWTARLINIGGMASGVVSAPGRTFRAFCRGRREQTTYGEDIDTLLDTTVAEARVRFAPTSRTAEMPKATAADWAAFALATVAGIAIGLPLAAAFLPLVPVGIAAGLLRRGQALA